jgi:hypothetical protein
MNPVTVFHLDGGFGICRTFAVRAPWWETPHCPSCTCTPPKSAIKHGHYVTCGGCEKIGVVPDPGHEADFMPAGVAVTTAEDGTRTWHFPVH